MERTCFRCRFEVAGNKHGVQCTTPLSFTIGDNRETPAFFYQTNSHIFNPVIAIIRIITHVKVRFYLVQRHNKVTVKLFFVIEDCILRSPPSRSTAEPLQTHTLQARAYTHTLPLDHAKCVSIIFLKARYLISLPRSFWFAHVHARVAGTRHRNRSNRTSRVPLFSLLNNLGWPHISNYDELPQKQFYNFYIWTDTVSLLRTLLVCVAQTAGDARSYHTQFTLERKREK